MFIIMQVGRAKQDHVIKLLLCEQFSVSVVIALAVVRWPINYTFYS